MPVKRIMIIDDEPDIVELLAFILSTKGYEVLKARDGREALNRLKSEIPDLIFLDLEMPQMGGYEVCYRIKNDPRFQKVPVIILTACSLSDEENERLEKMNVDGYVLKPFAFEDIMAHLGKCA